MNTPEEQNIDYYKKQQHVFLEAAEQMFGPKTKYNHGILTYDNKGPFTKMDPESIGEEIKTFNVYLNGKGAIPNRTDGIFQLSHEMIHLLSPVEQDEGNEANYLEEGMAVYFSKHITERETEDFKFCDPAIAKNERYARAYELYLSLIEIDKDAVKKLRRITPVIANIKSENFEQAGLKVSNELIKDLLTIF